MAKGMRRVSAMVGLVAAACSAALLTSAWVFYLDDRQPSRSAMVGTLAVHLPEGDGLGTAILVDECGILTNFHVVFGPWYVTALRPPSHAFVATFTLTEVTRPDGTHPTARATPVVWGDYRGPDRALRSPQNDWAYLVLDRCLGFEHGYFSLRSLDPEDLETGGDGFAAIGYSTGRQMLDPACAVRADPSPIRKGAWLHDCALMEGDSGGPIVKRGTLTAVALGGGFRAELGYSPCASGKGSALSRWDNRCANGAVPLTGEIIDRVYAAKAASEVQRALDRLGYGAGPLGAVDDPRAAAAIRQFQRNMKLPVTGEPSCALAKILALLLSAS
jgi:hypothetical protein